jgi:two-component system KDP operon response regulator KdpE
MTSRAPLVLAVEDEPQMMRFLRASLTAQSFRLVEATTARAAVASITTQNPEIILLDLGLPDRDGIELTREIRGWSSVPIIVISARGRESDKVDALDAGADDYLTKPFGVGELLARMRAALRRAAAPESAPIIEVGKLRIDLAQHQVTLDHREIHLTPIEYRLLTFLAKNSGRVLTQGQILEEVWGRDQAEQFQYLRVYMCHLRRKIEKDPARPQFLTTEPGVGYRLHDHG